MSAPSAKQWRAARISAQEEEHAIWLDRIARDEAARRYRGKGAVLLAIAIGFLVPFALFGLFGWTK